MSQSAQILAALRSGTHLTKLQILRQFGCINAGQRIAELREQGWPIDTDMVKRNGKVIAKYYLSGKHRRKQPYQHRVNWRM